MLKHGSHWCIHQRTPRSHRESPMVHLSLQIAGGMGGGHPPSGVLAKEMRTPISSISELPSLLFHAAYSCLGYMNAPFLKKESAECSAESTALKQQLYRSCSPTPRPCLCSRAPSLCGIRVISYIHFFIMMFLYAHSSAFHDYLNDA